MIILEKPYVSDFLIETIKNNAKNPNYSVLDNDVARKFFNSINMSDVSVNILKSGDCIDSFSQNSLIYTNSENSIDWILENLHDSRLAQMIKLCKDKGLFRKTIAPIYPDFSYNEYSFDELCLIKTLDSDFPKIIKPSVGFLSFGVHPIYSEKDFFTAVENIKTDVEKLRDVFPSSVVNLNKFIIEDMIEGEEYALDAYFDGSGKSVILNIFHHPFFDKNDVSDRVYYTSKKVLSENLSVFERVLDEIGSVCDFKNFPCHIELRKNGASVVPIEINPLRFCGWCICDIAKFSSSTNVYESFLNQTKPDWEKILADLDDSIYYFTMADIPQSVDRDKIKSVDFEKYLKNIKNPLEIRKIDYVKNPVFAIVFAKTPADDFSEIKNLLKLDMTEFLKF